MSNSLWTTLKKIGIDLPISPSNPLFHPGFRPRLSHDKKNVFSFTSRLSKENKRKEEIYLSRTVLLLTFTFSFISELSRGFAAMPCYGVNGLFCLFWRVLFLMLSSAFIFFIIILMCMHARFFFKEKLVILPAIYSFVVHSLYHLVYTFLSNLQTEISKMRLWQGTQI